MNVILQDHPATDMFMAGCPDRKEGFRKDREPEKNHLWGICRWQTFILVKKLILPDKI
jgi:hypothetical protein